MIIVPIMHQQKPKECVISSGVRYCKDTPTTKQDIGIMSLLAILFTFWMILIARCFVDWELYKTGVFIFLLPFIIGIVYSLF